MLGFDAYPRLGALLGDVLSGHRPAAHTPVDRRTLLPISPGRAAAGRRAAAVSRPRACPGVAARPVPRTLLRPRPGRPAEDRLRLRPALHVLRDPVIPGRVRLPAIRTRSSPRPRWLAEQGVREIVLVSENSTSFGKDLPGDGSSSGCSPRWPRCPASPGCGCPTCNRPRPGRG